MDPVITKILEGTPYAGMGSTLERNALIGVIRNLINEDKYTVEYIISYCESVGYQRQMAEDIFKELTGLSPKLIINNNEYYNGPSYLPPYSIAWGYSKTKPNTVNLIVPFEYGYAVMEKDEVNAPVATVVSATIPEAIDELKKVAKGIQTLDKIITKKLLETEDVPTNAETPHQVNKPYAASPLQILKKNFKDKVINVSEFERQASKLLASEEITVDEAEDLMAWKQDLIDEDETYGNDVLELNEQWNEVKAEINFDDVYNEVKALAEEDDDNIDQDNKAKALFDSNADLFKNIDLVEATNRLYQLLLGFSKDEILGHSKVEKQINKDMNKKSFQMHSKTGIREFHAWDQAKNTQKHIIEQGKADAFDRLIEECYPEGISKTQLNDLLWFESGWIYETLGMQKPYKDEEEVFEEEASKKQSSQSINELKQIIKNMKEEGKSRTFAINYLDGKGIDYKIINEILNKAGYNNENKVLLKGIQSCKKVKSFLTMTVSADEFSDIWNNARECGDEIWSIKDGKLLHIIGYNDFGDTIKITYEPVDDFELWEECKDDIPFDFSILEYLPEEGILKSSSKKVTAENMTLDDIEAEDNKDEVQEEIEKINEKPAEEIFSETTPEQYFEDALAEDKVDTINEVVSRCIDKFSEKFKDFDKYNVEILSYNTKVLGDYKPTEEEMVEDKELNANAILQVILAIRNNADESEMKKALAVFSVTNGELHWTGTVRGENDQVVAFTEEGLDALFEVNEPSEDELEDII